MDTSLEPPQGPDQAQTCVDRPDTALSTNPKQSLLVGDNRGDDKPSYTIWVRRVTPSGHPYLLAVENDYDVDSKEDSEIDSEDEYGLDPEDDPDEGMEMSLLRVWYFKLFCILEAIAILCYPITLRSYRVIAAIALRVLAIFKDKGDLPDDFLDLIIICVLFYTVGLCFIVVTEDPWRLRRKVWAITDSL